jgi:hypothetical protein
MVLDAGQERGDLFVGQIGQHPVGHEEVRSRALRDDGQPVLAGHRRGHHPAAAGVGEELPAQLDGVGQVQVDPVHARARASSGMNSVCCTVPSRACSLSVTPAITPHLVGVG